MPVKSIVYVLMFFVLMYTNENFIFVSMQFDLCFSVLSIFLELGVTNSKGILPGDRETARQRETERQRNRERDREVA